ncbi:hypothetical protein D3C83_94450 [compost metagenome]
MPSPVLIAPLVVKGNMRPAPPPAMITARASKRRIWPLRISIATKPAQRPCSTSNSVA